MINKLNKIFKDRKKVIIISAVLLSLITLFTSWCANLLNVTNADHLIYPYLFQDFGLHQIVVPMQHSNLLKYPLFILQSILPYNVISISIFNITTVVITVLSWYFLTLYVLKWKFSFSLSVIFSSILLGSELFNHEILGSTIRNVEFPITFAFIISLSILLINGLPKKISTRIFITASSLLYAITLAGDSFFLYVVSVPIILVVIGYGLFSRKFITKQLLIALVLVVFTSLAGIIIRKIIQFTGIVVFFNDPTFILKTVPIEHLLPSISVAIQQLLDLFGANIFGRTIDASTAVPFVNLIIFLLSIFGLTSIVVDVFKRKFKLGRKNTFVLLCLSVISFMTFIVYILSDLVVKLDASNQLVSAGQDRYLTFIVFISLTGIGHLLHKIANFRIHILFISCVSLALVIGLPSIINGLRDQYRTYAKPMNHSLTLIAGELKKNNVSFVLSGYWYASPTKLFSKNTIDFAPIGNCNHPQPNYNINQRWYIPSINQNTSSALIVDRTGPDKIYWPCSDDRLKSIYGIPEKIINISNGLSIYIYKYDVRTKLQ